MRVSPIREIDGRLVLPVAPETEDDAARLQDATSHMVVPSTDTVTVDDELYGPRNPGDTHLVILFTGAGEKRVVLATAYDGQTITIVKNDDASSIVLEPSGDGPTFRGSSSDATIQTSIAERRAFTIAALGDDYDYIGIPREHVTLALALANDPDAGGASIDGLGFVGITAADHETAALTIASSGSGGASSAWSIGSAVPSHAPGVGAHHVRVASSDDSALYVRHATGWVPYIRGNLNAGRVPYTLNSSGRVTSSSNLAFDGTNLSIAEPTADAHAATRAYVNKRSFTASGVSWTDGTNNGTADVHVERVGNVVAVRVSVTASGSTGPSIASAVGFLPEWARPSVTLSSLSDYHSASNTIFAIGAHANGQVTAQKRLISSSGITNENWTSSEERTLLMSYPVPAS